MDGKKPSKRSKKDTSGANDKKGKQANQNAKVDNQVAAAAENSQQNIQQQAVALSAVNHQQQIQQQPPDGPPFVMQLTDDVRSILQETADHYISSNTPVDLVLQNPLFRFLSPEVLEYFVEIFHQQFQQQYQLVQQHIRQYEAMALARQRKRSMENQDTNMLQTLQQYRQLPRSAVLNGPRPRGYLAQNPLPHSPTLKRTPVPGTPPGLAAFRKPGPQGQGPVFNDANRPGPAGMFNVKPTMSGPLFNDRQRMGGPVFNDVRQHPSLPSNFPVSSPQTQQGQVTGLPPEFDPFELEALQAPVQQNGGLPDDPLGFALGGGSTQDQGGDMDPFNWTGSGGHPNQLESGLDIGQDDMPPPQGNSMNINQQRLLQQMVQQRQRQLQVRPS